MSKRGKRTWNIPLAKRIKRKFEDGLHFVNVVKKGITENLKDRGFKIVYDGKRNDFPNFLISLVEPAPYTRAAIDKRRAFVAGTGLSDMEVSGQIVNDEYTFGELHRRLSQDFNYSDRFAFWVQPSRTGTVEKVKHIPFEWCRWGVPTEDTQDVWYVAINPYFNTSDEKPSETKYYPLYRFEQTSLAEDIARIEEQFPKQGYKGHVYFFNKPTPRSRHYSRPAYFAAENAIKVDAGIWQFHERNLANNFFIGGIINKWGDPNKGILDDNGDVYTTWGEEYANEVEAIASGVDNAGNFLVNWYQADNEKAEFTPWQASTNHEMITQIEAALIQVIATSLDIPPVLLGIQTAGRLGDVQEMRNAINWTNERTSEWREKLEEVYKMLLDAMGISYGDDFGIDKVQDITDIPQHIFAAMTPAQQQQFMQDEYNIEQDESPLITITPNGNGSNN